MITSVPRAGGGYDLRLFGADKLHEGWTEHPASPVLENDRQFARSAGRVTLTDGRIFRFAQGSIPHYGSDVRLLEITELSEAHYRERVVRQVPLLCAGEDAWRTGGMHHIDLHRGERNSWFACVDGWRANQVHLSNLRWTLQFPPPKLGPGDISKKFSIV